mgnify:CR=1 FL=1
MNDLTTFTNPEFGQVRTVEIDGTPWLVGKDVAVALGYKNPGKAIIAHVDEEDKRLEMLPQETDSQNGNASPASKTALINESGLYSLILSSLLSQLINTWPNRKLLDYRYLEQLKDILPSILLAVFMGCCMWLVNLAHLPDIVTLVIQILIGAAAYLGGSALLKLDTFEYLWNVVKPKIQKKPWADNEE